MKTADFADFRGLSPVWEAPAAPQQARQGATTAWLHSDGWEARPGAEPGEKKSIHAPGASNAAPAAPAPRQGPFAKLPLELGGKILAYLQDQNADLQTAPRLVSRAFYHASRLGQPDVNDRIVSGYLRQLLAHRDFVRPQKLENFVFSWTSKVLNLDLTGSYTRRSRQKDALLCQLLTGRGVRLGNLVVQDCPAVTELPKGLVDVAGDLNLRGTNIVRLPEGLTVGGTLDLLGTDIAELPRRLRVGGDLDLRGTDTTALPDEMTVGKSLYLSGSNITELPENLHVGGDLDLSGTDVRHLPRGLRIGGDVYLRGTGIVELPKDATVGGKIIG